VEKQLLEVRNLQVEYLGIPIVKNISLSLGKGEIFGIVGESGCGKSTLLSAILHVLGADGRIVGGRIFFDGKDMSLFKKEERRRIKGEHLGAVFQNPGESLNPSRKIETQFYEALKAHRQISKQESRKLAADMMERLNLEHGEELLKKYPFQLSGGMQQRVALALAMIMDPELLLADEPTSALDVTVQAQVIKEMMEMRDKFGTAILIVTHNMGVISHMADRVAVMYAGRIVEYGDKKRVLKNPSHPYTRSLLNAIPDFSGNLPKGLDGNPPPFGIIQAGCEFAERCPFATEDCKKIIPDLKQVEEEHFSTCMEKGD